MRLDRLWWAVGSLCLFTSGCFSYSPYGQPSPYGGPPQTVMGPQPLGSGVTPGAAWVPASPGVAPSGVTAPEPARRANSGAKDVFEEPADGKAVPDPIEPGKAKPEEGTEPFGFNDDREPELAHTVAGDSIATNSIVQTAEFTTQVRSDGVKPVSAQNEQFGHDAEGFTWLKGIAEFDRADQSWHLLYSPTPDEADPYGGEVTFKNTPHFKMLRSRETIRVEGRFDPNQRDRLGKPVYEVKRLIRAAPRS